MCPMASARCSQDAFNNWFDDMFNDICHPEVLELLGPMNLQTTLRVDAQTQLVVDELFASLASEAN